MRSYTLHPKNIRFPNATLRRRSHHSSHCSGVIAAALSLRVTKAVEASALVELRIVALSGESANSLFGGTAQSSHGLYRATLPYFAPPLFADLCTLIF